MPYLKTTAAPPTDLYFEDTGGSGQPVVLIHGWPLSGRTWEKQVMALRGAGYRCISYDRRGFGQSGHATGGYDYDTFASDLNDVLNELDLRNAVIVGFSMGGGEVARYIGRYGEGRIAKAAFISAVTPYLKKTDDNPDGVDPDTLEAIVDGVTKDRIAFLQDFTPQFYKGGVLGHKPNDDLIAFTKALAWVASPYGTQQSAIAFNNTDFRRDLEKVTVPTLIMHGDDDHVVPYDASAPRTAKLVKNSRLEKIGGAPHGLIATYADEANKILLDFLGS